MSGDTQRGGRPARLGDAAIGRARSIVPTVLLATALAIGAGRVSADVPGHWGAIAYGKGGVYGTARMFATHTEAAAAARQACGDRCTDVITFLRLCAALASGESGFAAVARDRYLDRARDFALARCRRQDSACRIRVSVCTHTE